MTSFQSTFYHISNTKQSNAFEVSFEEFKKQLKLYERQFSLTLNSYLKEWNSEALELKKRYEEEKNIAKKVYEDIMRGDDGKEDYAHDYAMNASNLEYIDHYFYEENEKINIKYKEFLDLYSKSILISLYSLNENQLNELGEIASNEFNKKIKPSHFNSRDYLISSITYLDLVIEIPVVNLEKYVTKLKDLQYLRNKIVHANSKFTDDLIIEKVKKYKESLSYDTNTSYLKIQSSKFIKESIILYREFYSELLWLIDIRQKHLIIKNGLKHWFGLLDRNIFITNLNSEKKSKAKRTILFSVSSRKKDLPKFNGRLIISKSKRNSVEIINQIDNKKINEFIETENKSGGYYLKKIFEVHTIIDTPLKIKLMIY